METAARKTDQALAIFAHELREPLASILFAVQAMNAGADDACAQREMCAIVERQSQYAAKMIEDVLEVCRGSAGKIRLHRERFDLRLVLARAVETISPLLIQRGHRLALALPEESVHILADAQRVQQVFVNLLANAAKYTNPGGYIRLAVEAMEDFVVVAVRDNGVGISESLLPRVFDFYRQGESQSGGGFAGLGIGLALVKSVIELHGGSVSAHSSGLGTGSTFVVRLPVRGGTIRLTADHQPRVSGCPRMDRRSTIDAMADA